MPNDAISGPDVIVFHLFDDYIGAKLNFQFEYEKRVRSPNRIKYLNFKLIKEVVLRANKHIFLYKIICILF